MIQMWKLPTGQDINFIKSLTGSNGTKLNPVPDINGDWFLSNEECISPEFNALKAEYADIVSQMVYCEFVELERNI